MSFKSLRQVAYYKPISRCGMEELAVDQISSDLTGGVRFARNLDGEQKAAARKKVLDIFSPENWPGRLNMLSMPGIHWRFERKLLGAREPGWLRRSSPHRTHFSTIENDRALYFSAVTTMPGIETPKALIKYIRPFPFSEMGVKTKYTAFFFANVDQLMEHDWDNHQNHHNQPGWDAAWLDYTGPLSVDRLKIIQRFYKKFIRGVLVVTSLKARWNRETSEAILRAGGHSEWLRKKLPGEVLHDLEYFDTSPMAQFAVRHSAGDAE